MILLYQVRGMNCNQQPASVQWSGEATCNTASSPAVFCQCPSLSTAQRAECGQAMPAGDMYTNMADTQCHVAANMFCLKWKV